MPGTSSSSSSASIAKHLVRDRFAEFQQVAKSKGVLLSNGVDAADVKSGTLPQAAVVGKPTGSMRHFYEKFNEITTTIGQGKQSVTEMGKALEQAMRATTQQQEQQASERLQALVEETNGYIAKAKRGMEDLKASSEDEAKVKPNASEAKIRANMQTNLVKKHQQLLMDFQKAQMDFKTTLERRQKRELEFLVPDATPEERAEMIQEGQTTSLLIAQKMAGAHASLVDEVNRIREKHQDILRLEKNIEDLAQMFQEIAVLVDAQGEMLDCIEANVDKTMEHTQKAEVELTIARKTQRNTQKWMCCLVIFLMILALVILGPVLIAT